MEIKNINTIAFYNIRLLLREKLLWFYTLGMYIVILFAQLSNQGILGIRFALRIFPHLSRL